MRIAIVTVSDSAARGERAHDVSGDAIAAWAAERGDEIVARAVVADDSVAIVRALLDACDRVGADLVLTTGGTGVSARDVTPEATRAVIEREATSFTEWMRESAMPTVPRAVLSRAIGGIRGRTLVLNLPGSPGAVRDGLATIAPVIAHACAVLRGTVGQHDLVSDAATGARDGA